MGLAGQFVPLVGGDVLDDDGGGGAVLCLYTII